MATRNGRRPRRAAEEQGGIAPEYEGPEALSALLARAGCPLDAGEVQGRFAEARARGLDRSAVIPGLFPSEPRFASPDEARRLYQNLFGLWERVAAGLPGEEAPPPPQRERRPLPPRGSLRGEVLPAGLVEAVWQELDALGPAERRRADERFESSQPDLSAWLAAVELPEAGGGAALGLTFEAWAMLDRAFGDRLGRAAWRDLAELADEPPALERAQPALAAYVAEQLENLADEVPALGAGERAQVERVVAAAVAALTRTLARDA
jgi:hypothetical protein